MLPRFRRTCGGPTCRHHYNGCCYRRRNRFRLFDGHRRLFILAVGTILVPVRAILLAGPTTPTTATTCREFRMLATRCDTSLDVILVAFREGFTSGTFVVCRCRILE